MHNYKDLKVWQKALELCTAVYKLTSGFPKEEKFGIISQIQRASVSIPSNIAEGAGRDSDLEFGRFLGIANESAFELETQLLIIKELGYSNISNVDPILENLYEVQRMLHGLKKNLKSQY